MTPQFLIKDGICTCTTCHAVIPGGATDWRPRTNHDCRTTHITKGNPPA